MKTNSLNVVYFGVEDKNYPRNKRIRAYLEDLGHVITIANFDPEQSALKRHVRALSKALLSRHDNVDVVVLSEFSIPYFYASWLLAKRYKAKHVVDFFVGKHETVIGDWRRYRERSAASHLYKWLDRQAANAADLIFTDTEPRQAFFAGLTRKPTPAVVLPVGVPVELRPSLGDPRPPSGRSTLHVLYYGHYAALHGIETLVEGLLLASQAIPISVTLVGSGTGSAQARDKLRNAANIRAFEFRDFAAPDELRKILIGADIVLGVFGTSAKAGSVIPNKVWQGLSFGKRVITRQSEAYEALPAVLFSYVTQTRAGKPQEIASALKKAWTTREVLPEPAQQSENVELYVKAKFDEAFQSMPASQIFRGTD